jgi:hypothetical protein
MPDATIVMDDPVSIVRRIFNPRMMLMIIVCERDELSMRVDRSHRELSTRVDESHGES